MITSQPSGPSGGDWRSDAACRGTNPERFFPTSSGTGPRRIEEEARAKQVCRRCPVTEQCLAWALESGQDYGVWGGQSAAERRALKRRNEPAAENRAPKPDPELAAFSRSATTAEKRQHARRAIEVQRQPRTAVAAAFGVSTRTVDRWLAHERDRTPCPA